MNFDFKYMISNGIPLLRGNNHAFVVSHLRIAVYVFCLVSVCAGNPKKSGKPILWWVINWLAFLWWALDWSAFEWWDYPIFRNMVPTRCIFRKNKFVVEQKRFCIDSPHPVHTFIIHSTIYHTQQLLYTAHLDKRPLYHQTKKPVSYINHH